MFESAPTRNHEAAFLRAREARAAAFRRFFTLRRWG